MADGDRLDRGATTEHTGSAPHEVGCFLWYTGSLAPYWALSGALTGDPFEGHIPEEDPIEVTLPTHPDGGQETWRFHVYYQQGTIEPLSDFGLGHTDSMYEWRLIGRGAGERKASFHIRPRFEGMNISTPWEQLWDDLDDDPDASTEGLDVSVNGSNVELGQFPTILQAAVDSVIDAAGANWRSHHLDPAEVDPVHSTITTYERYVRISRQFTNTLVQSDGYLMQLMHLLASNRGSNVTYKADNTEVVGYNHRMLLPRKSARELPWLTHGIQLKFYHPKHARQDASDDDPLAHPKFGVLFKKGQPQGDNGSGPRLNKAGVSWGDRDDLTHELEETIINTLEHAGVPTDPNVAFVPDEHFNAEPTDRRIQLYDDPTPDLEIDREAAIIRAFADLTDADQDFLDVLADGGEMHYTEAADRAGYNESTVYRFLKRLGDVVKSDNGILRWTCRKVADDVREILDAAERQHEAQAQAVSNLLDMNPRIAEKMSGALQKWLHKWAIELAENPEDDSIRIKIATMCNRFRAGSDAFPWIGDVIQEGLTAWAAAGRDSRVFKRATIVYLDRDGTERELSFRKLRADL